ncbi:MAG: RluA family pseudouridine synthase, partial [Balneolaceae bacterium]
FTGMLVEKENPNRTEYLLEVPDGQHSDIRLDKYITSFVQNATRNKVQKAIKDGRVMVNGRKEKPSYIMQSGDKIEIILPKPPPQKAKPEKMDLDIIFEDEDLLIVNKPPGLVVHPAFGNWTGTLVNGLLYHTGKNLSNADKETLRPGIVHRLDKDTSGLLVVAKNEETHSKLARQFAIKAAERTYWAIAWGDLPEEGSIEGNIGRSPRNRKIMTVRPENEGKKAVTHFKKLESFDHLALLEIQLETGRTHQIRVHMQHKGYFVFGDSTYGGDRVRYGPNTGSRKAMFNNLFTALNRQALHAKTLGFVHPTTEKFIEFDSSLPHDFKFVLEKLRNNCKTK